jgi:hypothetical protein
MQTKAYNIKGYVLFKLLTQIQMCIVPNTFSITHHFSKFEIFFPLWTAARIIMHFISYMSYELAHY